MGRRTVTGSTLGADTGPQSLPVESLAHNPRNARDGYADVDELAESIRAAGVLQALGVVRQETFLTHYPEHEHEIGVRDWVVVAGNRRLAAARLAGLTEVPVRAVDHLGRDGMLDEAVLVENIHRAELPPLREAEVLRMLVERHGSQAAVAARITKSQAFVSQRIALLSLSPELQQALRAGTLTVEEARSRGRLPAEQQADHHAVKSAPRKMGRPRALKFGEPTALAEQLRERYTPEQRAELARLLTTDP